MLLVGSWLAVAARADVAAALERTEALLSQQEAALRGIALLTDREVASLRRSRNDAHVAQARRLGVAPLPDRAAFETGLLRDSLPEVHSTDRYRVARMRYGVPALTRDAVAVLDSIAVRFESRLAEADVPPFRFVLTSALRTTDDQARLGRVNVNAARGRSSHEYGTTFDLTYRRFARAPLPEMLPDSLLPERTWLRPVAEPLVRERLDDGLARLAEAYPSRLAAVLGRALIALEDDGLLLVVRERRQPVFHVTVARALAE